MPLGFRTIGKYFFSTNVLGVDVIVFNCDNSQINAIINKILSPSANTRRQIIRSWDQSLRIQITLKISTKHDGRVTKFLLILTDRRERTLKSLSSRHLSSKPHCATPYRRYSVHSVSYDIPYRKLTRTVITEARLPCAIARGVSENFVNH